MNQSERTEAQKEASRNNGAKSQGPVTDEGKAASSQNAVKHGLYSRTTTLINEDAEDFQAVLADYRAIHQPANREEDDIVRTMASAQFRKERMDHILTALIDQPLGPIHDDFVKKHGDDDVLMYQAAGFKAAVDNSRAVDLAHKMMLQYDRLYHRNRTALERIQKARKAAAPQNHAIEPEAKPAPAEAPIQNSRFKPEDYLHGMTYAETLDLLSRDIYRPDTIDRLCPLPKPPDEAPEEVPGAA